MRANFSFLYRLGCKFGCEFLRGRELHQINLLPQELIRVVNIVPSDEANRAVPIHKSTISGFISTGSEKFKNWYAQNLTVLLNERLHRGGA